MNTEFLLVKRTLSITEKDVLSQELVAKLEEEKTEENEKKASAKKHDAKIKDIRNQINTLSKNIREGIIIDQVECTVEKDFDNGVKRFYDKSSGELLDTQKLSPEELQLAIE